MRVPVGPQSTKAAFTDLQRRMGAIERDLMKELAKELRRVTNEVRDVVRGSTADPFATGKSRKSVRSSVRKKYEASLYSNLPQVPVQEWGGVIKPRGVPIEFKPTNFVRGTVVALADDIDQKLGDAFDRIAARKGFL